MWWHEPWTQYLFDVVQNTREIICQTNKDMALLTVNFNCQKTNKLYLQVLETKKKHQSIRLFKSCIWIVFRWIMRNFDFYECRMYNFCIFYNKDLKFVKSHQLYSESFAAGFFHFQYCRIFLNLDYSKC